MISIARTAKRYAPNFIRKMWHERNLDLFVDPKQFRRFSYLLQPAMAYVAETRFYRYEEQRGIPGWMTPKERQILYGLALHIPGPITEIGSWAGLSTTAIARGVSDSETRKQFRTYDLRLTPDNFRLVNGKVGMFLPGDDRAAGETSVEEYERNILPVISAPGGASAILRRHLSDLGLLDLTEINVGDFKSFKPVESGFLFCDALHDAHEIEVNGPALNPWLRTGSVLACHDIGGSPDLIELLRKRVGLGAAIAVDSLYVAEVV